MNILSKSTYLVTLSALMGMALCDTSLFTFDDEKKESPLCIQQIEASLQPSKLLSFNTVIKEKDGKYKKATKSIFVKNDCPTEFCTTLDVTQSNVKDDVYIQIKSAEDPITTFQIGICASDNKPLIYEIAKDCSAIYLPAKNLKGKQLTVCFNGSVRFDVLGDESGEGEGENNGGVTTEVRAGDDQTGGSKTVVIELLSECFSEAFNNTCVKVETEKPVTFQSVCTYIPTIALAWATSLYKYYIACESASSCSSGYNYDYICIESRENGYVCPTLSRSNYLIGRECESSFDFWDIDHEKQNSFNVSDSIFCEESKIPIHNKKSKRNHEKDGFDYNEYLCLTVIIPKCNFALLYMTCDLSDGDYNGINTFINEVKECNRVHSEAFLVSSIIACFNICTRRPVLSCFGFGNEEKHVIRMLSLDNVLSTEDFCIYGKFGPSHFPRLIGFSEGDVLENKEEKSSEEENKEEEKEEDSSKSSKKKKGFFTMNKVLITSGCVAAAVIIIAVVVYVI